MPDGRAAFYLVAGVLVTIVLVAGVLVFHSTPPSDLDNHVATHAPQR